MRLHQKDFVPVGLALETAATLGVDLRCAAPASRQMKTKGRPDLIEQAVSPPIIGLVAFLNIEALLSLLVALDPIDNGNVHNCFARPDHA